MVTLPLFHNIFTRVKKYYHLYVPLILSTLLTVRHTFILLSSLRILFSQHLADMFLSSHHPWRCNDIVGGNWLQVTFGRKRNQHFVTSTEISFDLNFLITFTQFFPKLLRISVWMARFEFSAYIRDNLISISLQRHSILNSNG